MAKTAVILGFLMIVGQLTAQDTSGQDLNGSVLKVGVNVAPPLAYQSGPNKFDGPMVDLWGDVAANLNLSFELYPTDVTSGIEGLQDSTFDILIGGITITADRELEVDFSPSIIPSGVAVVVSKSRIPNKFEAYYEPILLSLLQVIGVLLAFMLSSAFLVWIVERKDRHHTRDKQIRHFGDGIWWSAVTLSTVGYGDKVPHTRVGRFIGIAWIFVGVILISFFTASTAAILSKPVPEIALTITDILDNEVGALRGSAAAEFLDTRKVPYRTFDNLNTLLNAVSENEIEVAVGNVPQMRDALRSSTTHNLLLSQRLLAYTFMAWGFPDQSPLLELIDESLLHVITEERWQDALNEYIHRN